MNKKYTIKELGNRKLLMEGRRYQMGFSLLRKLKSIPVYVALYPFSTCKDYINDFCFTEKTGLFVEAYGITTSAKRKIVIDDHFYLGVKILKYADGQEYNHPAGLYGPSSVDKERLKANIQNVLKVLNHFDTLYNVPPTIVEEVDGDTFVFKINKFWFAYAYRMSFYTLMIRISQFWNGEGSVEDFIKKGYNNPLDTTLLTDSLPFIEPFFKGEALPEFDFSSLDQSMLMGNLWEEQQYEKCLTYNTIHNGGIKGMLMPTKVGYFQNHLERFRIKNVN